MLRKILLSVIIGIVYLVGISSAFSQIHHQMKITLDPSTHRIKVIDTIDFDLEASPVLKFSLHSSLKIKIIGNNAGLKKLSHNPLYSEYELTLPTTRHRDNFENTVLLEYQGEIYQALENTSKDYARSFNETSGIISQDGIFLSASSYWYPIFQNQLLSFDLNITLPKDWISVSQGTNLDTTASDKNSNNRQLSNTQNWKMEQPQQEIYLIAAKFYRYQQQTDSINAQVYLRSEDRSLAQKYLDVTARYIKMYQLLIGEYPYSKFALVENFWETGYGMPSFTLLGSKVIRLPFILHSSYPHEILHNWFGNSIYVDYESGNWSEGLTSYIADHLIKEQRGQATSYRRAALQKYSNFVRSEQDFALSEFTSRDSAISEAIGYGKSLMFFHMMRITLADTKFKRALKRLYRMQKFKVTRYSDIKKVFKSVIRSSSQKQWLESIFNQWLNRTGAPALKLDDYNVIRDNNGFRFTAVLTQTQKEPVFSVEVPLVFTLQNDKKTFNTKVRMTTRKHKIDMVLASLPLQLDIDPEFDIFRRLDGNEIPPSINQVFGAKKLLIVLPSKAKPELLAGYQKLAKNWQDRQQSNIDIKFDKELVNLPNDRAIWFLGWQNLFRDYLNTTLRSYNVKNLSDQEISINEQLLSASEYSVVLTSRNKIKSKNNNKYALAWLASDNVNAIPGLARKLPHYGKYSYLAFTGDEPTISVKGQWPIVNSPMSISLSKIKLADKKVTQIRHALANMPPAFSQTKMLQDVQELSSEKYAGRGLGTAELEQAALFIQQAFQEAGLQAGGDRDENKEIGYLQKWQTTIDDETKIFDLQNVIGLIPGTDPKLESESLIIAAHYDHLGLGWPDVHQGDQGKIHSGADDNASGVAVMLEVARLLAKGPAPKRTIIFVAFTAEEAGKLGSGYYIDHLKDYPKDKIIAMINLDTVGRLENKPITVFGNNSANEWVHIFRGVSHVTGIAIQAVNNDLDSSDHNSFLDIGVPAIQFFSGVNLDFHRPSDSSDKIDANGLVKVATVVKETLDYLASRSDFLTSNLSLSRTKNKKTNKAKSKRRVTLGTIPDFKYSGNGVRVEGVISGSPAAKAKLQRGDILVKMNNAEISSLRDFANVLRKLKAGDKVELSISRKGIIHEISTNVVAR